MAAECQQTSKNLAAYTQRYLSHNANALSDYTGYSIQNNNITATLLRSYSIIDGQSVLVSSNHSPILTTKSSTHIRYLLGNKKAKSHDGGQNVTVSPVSKAQDLVMPCLKKTGTVYALCLNCGCLTCSR